MIQNKQLTSDVITALRFPLILGVLLIHNAVGDWNIPVYGTIQDIMSVQMVSPCVTLFFFFSGYLFFYKNQESFTMRDYGTKLKKRVRSLFVPYIFWTVVVLMYFALAHKFLPQLINPEFNNVYNFTAEEWIRAFWDYPGGQPVCYQFWFLRDLMVGVVLSPIIYYVAKYGKWYVAALLAILYVYKIGLFPYQIMLTFFTMGACFSVNQYDFVGLTKTNTKTETNTKAMTTWVALIVFIICIVLSETTDWNMRGFQTFVGMIAVVGLAAILIENGCKASTFLAGSSFFVYAFHGFPIQVLGRLLVKVLNPESVQMWVLCYFLNFFIIVSISLILYKLLKSLMPRFTAVITGGR